MDKIKPNAYRAIQTKYLKCYAPGGNLGEVPKLTGEHFTAIGKNNHVYVPDKKYLHFFPNEGLAQSYANDLGITLAEDISVVAFYFDPAILENFTFEGEYFNGEYRPQKVKEYIIPIELYDPSIQFMGEVSKNEKIFSDPDNYREWF